MAAWMAGVGSATAPYAYPQAELGASLGRLLGGERETRVMRQLARQTEVAFRQSVLPDFDDACETPLLYDGNGSPGTAARSAVYEALAPPLAATAARAALADADLEVAGVTHLVTVSCTGFFAPGLDVRLIEELGLSPGVKRYHLGFMGCCAALPALDLAAELVRANAAARVLVVCCELCSLHFQGDGTRDNLLSASLFGDGAAAAVVDGRGSGARIGRHGSFLIPESEDAMSWRVGDHGFVMGLAKEVPQILAAQLPELLRESLASEFADLAAVTWAVHPGGAAILDACEAGLGLEEGGLVPSRTVLREHGNVSSATILLVLQRLLRAESSAPIGMLAFGPGLTANWLTLTR